MAGYDPTFKDTFHLGHVAALLAAILLPTLPASLTLLGYLAG